MAQLHGGGSASSARLEALRARHKNLSEKIEIEQNRPFISEFHIGQLKREKLMVKEEMEGIRKAS